MQVIKGLGRLSAPDPRDLNHLLRAARPSAFAVPIEALPEVKNYARGPILDQGQTGTCVEYSLRAKLAGAPCMVGGSRQPPLYAIYDAAIASDEFPDNDHDTARQYGTSIRAGCKVLQGLGLISEYTWAFDEDEVLRWILGGHGGLVLGIPWLSKMGDPDQEGIIRAHGVPQGGHAIYAFGADRVRGMIHLQNSWGEEFGGWYNRAIPQLATRRIFKGCVRLPLEDLRKLMNQDGEAVQIVETPYVRRLPWATNQETSPARAERAHDGEALQADLDLG